MNTKGFYIFTAATLYGHIGMVMATADVERAMRFQISVEGEFPPDLGKFGDLANDNNALVKEAMLRCFLANSSAAGVISNDWEKAIIIAREGDVNCLADYMRNDPVLFISEKGVDDFVKDYRSVKDLRDLKTKTSIYSPAAQSLMTHAFASTYGPHSAYQKRAGKENNLPYVTTMALAGWPVGSMVINRTASETAVVHKRFMIPVHFKLKDLKLMEDSQGSTSIQAQYRFLLNAMAASCTHRYHSPPGVGVQRNLIKPYPGPLARVYLTDYHSAADKIDGFISKIEATPDGLMVHLDMQSAAESEMLDKVQGMCIVPTNTNQYMTGSESVHLACGSFRIGTTNESVMEECMLANCTSNTPARDVVDALANVWNPLMDARHARAIEEIAADTLQAILSYSDAEGVDVVGKARPHVCRQSFNTMKFMVRRFLRTKVVGGEDIRTVWHESTFAAAGKGDHFFENIYGGVINRLTWGFIPPSTMAFLQFVNSLVSRGIYEKIGFRYLPLGQANEMMYNITGLSKYKPGGDTYVSHFQASRIGMYDRSEPTKRDIDIQIPKDIRRHLDDARQHTQQ